MTEKELHFLYTLIYILQYKPSNVVTLKVVAIKPLLPRYLEKFSRKLCKKIMFSNISIYQTYTIFIIIYLTITTFVLDRNLYLNVFRCYRTFGTIIHYIRTHNIFCLFHYINYEYKTLVSFLRPHIRLLIEENVIKCCSS